MLIIRRWSYHINANRSYIIYDLLTYCCPLFGVVNLELNEIVFSDIQSSMPILCSFISKDKTRMISNRRTRRMINKKMLCTHTMRSFIPSNVTAMMELKGLPEPTKKCAHNHRKGVDILYIRLYNVVVQVMINLHSHHLLDRYLIL